MVSGGEQALIGYKWWYLGLRCYGNDAEYARGGDQLSWETVSMLRKYVCMRKTRLSTLKKNIEKLLSVSRKNVESAERKVPQVLKINDYTSAICFLQLFPALVQTYFCCSRTPKVHSHQEV